MSRPLHYLRLLLTFTTIVIRVSGSSSYVAHLLPSSSSSSALHVAARHDDDTDNRDAFLSNSCLRDNFHYPHHCTVPYCDFMVSWREEGEMVTFNLTAKVEATSMVWAAIGFSDDRRMVDSDVVLCYLKGAGESEVHMGLILTDRPRVVKILDDVDNGAAVVPHSVKVKENKLHCSCFSRKMTISEHSEEWRSLTQRWHILLAAGQLYSPEGSNATVMRKHFKKAASNCKCNVTLCSEQCDCPDGFRYQLVKLHGIFMSLAFIFFIPFGALISRYYKMVLNKSWFMAHLAMMCLGVLWSLVGFGMVLGHTGGMFSVGIHQIVGITCLSLLVIQPIIAFLRPPAQPVTIRRVLFNAFHKTMAISILTTSNVALFMGVYIFCNVVMTWTMAVLGLSVLTNLGFILLLELLTRTHKFSTIPPVGYHKVTKNDDLSESEEEVFVRDDPNKKTKNGRGGGERSKGSSAYKMEKTMLVIFVVQAVIFAVLVASLLYYFDSHKHGD